MLWSRRTVLSRLGGAGLGSSLGVGLGPEGPSRSTAEMLAWRAPDHHAAAADTTAHGETCPGGDRTDVERAEPGTSVEVDGITILLEQLDDATVGAKAVTIHVEAKDGEPLTNALVFVAIRMPSMDHGVSAYPARELEDGRYRADDVSLGMVGEWLVSVGVIRQARAPITATYQLDVAAP